MNLVETVGMNYPNFSNVASAKNQLGLFAEVADAKLLFSITLIAI